MFFRLDRYCMRWLLKNNYAKKYFAQYLLVVLRVINRYSFPASFFIVAMECNGYIYIYIFDTYIFNIHIFFFFDMNVSKMDGVILKMCSISRILPWQLSGNFYPTHFDLHRRRLFSSHRAAWNTRKHLVFQYSLPFFFYK